MSLKCDSCGRFATDTYYVFGPIPQDGPDREACAQCHPYPGQVTTQQAARLRTATTTEGTDHEHARAN